jgi:hypothetical protein
MSAIKLLRSHRASLRSMDTKSLARAISKCHGNTQAQQFGCTVASLPTAVRNNLVLVPTKKIWEELLESLKKFKWSSL